MSFSLPFPTRKLRSESAQACIHPNQKRPGTHSQTSARQPRHYTQPELKRAQRNSASRRRVNISFRSPRSCLSPPLSDSKLWHAGTRNSNAFLLHHYPSQFPSSLLFSFRSTDLPRRYQMALVSPEPRHTASGWRNSTRMGEHPSNTFLEYRSDSLHRRYKYAKQCPARAVYAMAGSIRAALSLLHIISFIISLHRSNNTQSPSAMPRPYITNIFHICARLHHGKHRNLHTLLRHCESCETPRQSSSLFQGVRL